MLRTLLSLSFLLLWSSVFAQRNTGSFHGKIMDSKTAQPLVGATILLKGTSLGALTTTEGVFMIGRIPTGVYKIVISSIGYQSKEISDVNVEEGKLTQLYTTLQEDVTQLGEIAIVATRKTDTEVSVISELRLSQNVAVGVSGEQISKTQDADGAQVLKRLPGISIFDDRFIMIRGLSERYNAVLFNGTLVPSTEVDTKAFSFDLLPSSIIDRMIISKSGSYDLPGEFAGGIIRIFTKNTPEENFTNVSFTTGYRAGTTGKMMSGYKGGKTDWLGFDDGTRKLPGSFPTTVQMQAETNQETLITREGATRHLSSTWLPEKYTALPDYKLSVAIGRSWSIGSKTVSNLTSFSYNSTRQLIENLQRARYQSFNPDLGRSESNYDFNDNSSSDQIRIGAMHNWTLRVNNKHRFEFRNFFNQLGASQTVIRTGSDAGQSSQVKNYSLYYESRRIFFSQLAGFHHWQDEDWSADWLFGYATTTRKEPDFRRYITSFAPDIQQYRVPNPSGNNSLDQNARFFSSLNENTYTLAGNIERKIRAGEEGKLDDISIKAGVYTENKQRTFNARIFVFGPSALFSPVESPELNNPLPEILFTPSSIGVTKYLLQEGTKASDHYTASSQLLAGYMGTNIPLRKWNIATGLRLEHNTQKLESATDGRAIAVNNPVLSVLPSLNIAYNITDRMLVRTAYSGSVNRPEFREYAPFMYYDFNNRVNVEGNDQLRIPKIYNLDLRWELYPSLDELISLGVFYKHFKDPIELKISGAANSSANWQSINASFANSYGVEIEIRKSFVEVTGYPILRRISTVLNASYIYNRVHLGNLSTQANSRQMMNQSPYLINAGFFYNHPEAGWQASLLYNVFGPRLFYAGDVINGEPGNYPDAFELPRNQVDFLLTKAFNKVEVRIGVQDLLNAPYRFYQDSNRDGKIQPGNPDERVLLFRKGQNVTLGFKYTW